MKHWIWLRSAPSGLLHCFQRDHDLYARTSLCGKSRLRGSWTEAFPMGAKKCSTCQQVLASEEQT